MGKPLSSAVVLVLLLSAAPCFCDGKVFAKAKVIIPDQRVFISYRDGIEYLAIETDFQGIGNEFAWLIPTPSAPEVKEVSSGFFPTLQVLFHPEMKHKVPQYYMFYLFSVFVIMLLAIVFFGLHRIVPSVLLRCVICLLVFIVMGFMVPVERRSRVRGPQPEPSGVSIHHKALIGAYEVISLSSDDAQDLLSWLKQNDYKMTSGDAEVIEEYVQQGWFFTTVRLRVDSDGKKPYTPHPLAFIFKTDKPVYPLKLTGVNNEQCHIELYVFGPERAESDGFQVLRCTRPEYPPLEDKIKHGDFSYNYDAKISRPVVRHKELRSAIRAAPVLTKLSRTFAPGEVYEDAYLTWKPSSEQREIYYSHQYAQKVAIICSLVLLMSLIIIILPIKRFLPKNRYTSKTKGLFALAIVFAFIMITKAGFLIYSQFPTREVVFRRRFAFITEHDFSEIIEYRIKENERLMADGKLTKNELRQALAAYLKEHKENNDYTGTLIKEENSPGNYMIKGTEDNPQLVYFDNTGGEIIAWPEEEEE